VGCNSHKSAESHFAKAQRFEKDQNYNAAIIELKNTLQKEPGHKQARELLGKVYLYYRDGVSSEKELRKAISLGVPSNEVMVPLAEALAFQGKFDEALNLVQLDETLPVDKKNEIYLLRGNIFLAKKDMAQAELSFNKALELKPDNSKATIGLAKVNLANEKVAKANDLLSSISEQDPNAVDMLVLKAKIALNQRDYATAQSTYQKALTLSQNQKMVSQSIDLQGKLVMVQINADEIDKAKQNIKQLMDIAPDSLMTIYLHGLIAYREKDYDVAIESLQRVVAKLPEHLPSLLLLGAINYSKGNFEQANTYLTTFVNKVPTHLHARKLLGMVRLKLHKPGEALEVLKSASESQQKNDAQLLSIIGQAASASGDFSAGVDYLKQAKKAQPENNEIRSELAKMYLSHGAYDSAISELEAVTGTTESQIKAKVLLVYSYLRKEDFSKARSTAQKLLDDFPNDPDLIVVMGGVEMIAGDRDKARKYFNDALQINTNFALARMNLARMDFEDGELNGASKQYDLILANNPKDISALLGMAQIAEKLDNIDESIKWLEKARQANSKALVPRVVLGKYYLRTGKYEQALSVATEAFENNKTNLDVIRLVAASLVKLNRMEEAQNTFKQAIDADPQNPQWYLELASLYTEEKNYYQAVQALKKALSLNKDFLPAKANLAGIDILQGHLDSALKMANKIKQEHPKSSIGFQVAGDVYVRQKYYAKAQQSYIDGFSVNPDVVLVNKIFMLSSELKNYQPSIDISTKWLNKNPSDTTGMMYLGLAYQGQNKNDLAEQQYQKILDMQPNNVVALNNMAYVVALTDAARALQYATRAKQLQPDNFAILDTYGWVLTQSGNAKDGVSVLEKALQMSKDNPSVGYHYAVALANNNEKSKAASVLQKITESGSQFEELAQAKALLSKIQ